MNFLVGFLGNGEGRVQANAQRPRLQGKRRHHFSLFFWRKSAARNHRRRGVYFYVLYGESDENPNGDSSSSIGHATSTSGCLGHISAAEAISVRGTACHAREFNCCTTRAQQDDTSDAVARSDRRCSCCPLWHSKACLKGQD